MTAAVPIAAEAAESTVGSAASKATGGAGKAAAGKTAGRDPRRTAPGSKAARQRQAVEDIKSRRQAREDIANNPAVQPGDGHDGTGQQPSPTTNNPVSQAAGVKPAGGSPSVPPAASAAVSTGSGFLLGVFVWAIGLAYLQGGSAGVKRFFDAKFFNKTGAAPAAPKSGG